MSEIVLEDVGPNGNVQAIVEMTREVTYLYLYGATNTNFTTKAVWVRNHVAAPSQLDSATMQQGQAPVNVAAHCQHPEGLPPLDPSRLYVTWLPEGNGAALCDDTGTLAIIPPWSGSNGFHGYAKECLGEGPLAWELTDDNVMLDRFQSARDYWTQWERKECWSEIQTAMLENLESQLSAHDKYYAIDGGYWPPKSIVRIPLQDGVALISLGMSVRPQPNVELYTETPNPLRRVELGALIPSGWSDEEEEKFLRYLSGQTGLPWDQYSWLGDGHTLPCDSWRNSDFQFALLSRNAPGFPQVNLAEQFGDPVNLLWFVPTTDQERQLVMDQGSDRLRRRIPDDRWRQA